MCQLRYSYNQPDDRRATNGAMSMLFKVLGVAAIGFAVVIQRMGGVAFPSLAMAHTHHSPRSFLAR